MRRGEEKVKQVEEGEEGEEGEEVEEVGCHSRRLNVLPSIFHTSPMLQVILPYIVEWA